MLVVVLDHAAARAAVAEPDHGGADPVRQRLHGGRLRRRHPRVPAAPARPGRAQTTPTWATPPTEPAATAVAGRRSSVVRGRISWRAASVRLPDSDGYTANVCAIWSTVSVLLHRQRHGQDQLAGPRRDHHAAEHDPGAAAGEQLDEAVPEALHLGPRVGGQRQLDDQRVRRARTRPPAGDTPTVAISGSVKMVAATWLSRSGCTASPSACHIAIRPCMAATEASIMHAGAVAGRVDARRRGPGHPVHRDEPAARPGVIPASSRPSPPVSGTMPDGEQAVRAAHGPAVLQGHRDPVAGRA